MLRHQTLSLPTRDRGTYEITEQIQTAVKRARIDHGLCHLFLHHTSASLILCENADPSVQDDLSAFFQRLVPDGDPLFSHTAEGPDDMPAHVRSILTQNSLSLPVIDGRCDLGTWQGVFLWEHRRRSHTRRLTVTVLGADLRLVGEAL